MSRINWNKKGIKASFGVNKDIKGSLLGKNISQKAEFSTAMFFNKSRFFNRESKNLVTRTTMIKHKQWKRWKTFY